MALAICISIYLYLHDFMDINLWCINWMMLHVHIYHSTPHTTPLLFQVNSTKVY